METQSTGKEIILPALKPPERHGRDKGVHKVQTALERETG